MHVRVMVDEIGLRWPLAWTLFRSRRERAACHYRSDDENE